VSAENLLCIYPGPIVSTYFFDIPADNFP